MIINQIFWIIFSNTIKINPKNRKINLNINSKNNRDRNKRNQTPYY